ncbi:EAL domain-containing protein, partial [Romboutsia sp.]|uniref:EAL domain-containing protein n=1 Tax=Romboutsia sp. TaxID=1965302 RepID=UPI003F33D31C
NMEKSIDIISELKNLGIEIFLDDFGTGYSSLNYLVKLPISSIKIDKSFINEIPKKRMYNSLVKLITDLAHTMGIYVVAEGVEELSQLEMLRIMKVDVIQGYIYSKPLKEEEAKALTKSIKFEML